jgi:hypothetical protein
MREGKKSGGAGQNKILSPDQAMIRYTVDHATNRGVGLRNRYYTIVLYTFDFKRRSLY